MNEEMKDGEIFHATHPSTASADGSCSSQAADDDLHFKEVEMHVEEDLHPPETFKELDETHHTIIDTAAPFESVKAAVTRFRGDPKTEETQNTERQKIGLQVELKKIQEETLKYKKKYEETEASKEQILKEVDDQTRFAEDLKLQLENAEIEEEQSKQDCRLMLLRLKEVEDGIDSSESAAIKAQIEVAKRRHATAAAEMESVSRELQSIQSDYALMLQERELAVKRAAEVDSSSKESKKSVNDAALVLMKTDAWMESACAEQLGAEERKAAAALSLEIEKMVWDEAVEHAKEELLQLEQDTELTNDQSMSDEDSAASATSTVESEIEKAERRVSCLRTELYSLQSELEAEKASLTALAEKEGLASATISALKKDLRRMNHKLQLTKLSRDEVHEEEIETMMQPAIEEAEKAKVAVESAQEELKIAKKDAEKAAALATVLEKRITAAYGQIGEANKPIESLESPETKATQAGDGSSNEGVTMTLEEFRRLTEKADRVKKQKADRVNKQNIAAAAPSQISSKELKEAKRSLKEKKRVLEEATYKALMAEEEAILVEQQMRICREEKGTSTEEMDECTDMADFSIEIVYDEDSIQADDVYEECLDGDSDGEGNTSSPPHQDWSSADGGAAEHRRRKRVSLTRVANFLSKKKPPHNQHPK